jgi:aryl-alcohol dehydrogenase-like predicted oxidoreductase
MKTRRLGRTGFEISELVFGCGDVGGLMTHGDPADARRAFDRALADGVNWFDTAANYGQGKSEETLGRLMKETGARPHVSTKVPIDVARLGDIASQVEASAEASLRRLGLERFDLLQLHNSLKPKSEGRFLGADEVLKKGGVADALERLKARGVARFIGFTCLGDTASCRRVAESGRFDTAQVYYNLLNPSAARAMPGEWTGQDFGALMAALKKHDTGIIAIRVLAAGIIASDTRTGREFIMTDNTDVALEERRQRAIFAALGDGHGTRAQTAIRFALANADIAGVNVGFASTAQLEEALDAVARGPLPTEAIARLDAVYTGDFAAA